MTKVAYCPWPSRADVEALFFLAERCSRNGAMTATFIAERRVLSFLPTRPSWLETVEITVEDAYSKWNPNWRPGSPAMRQWADFALFELAPAQVRQVASLAKEFGVDCIVDTGNRPVARLVGELLQIPHATLHITNGPAHLVTNGSAFGSPASARLGDIRASLKLSSRGDDDGFMSRELVMLPWSQLLDTIPMAISLQGTRAFVGPMLSDTIVEAASSRREARRGSDGKSVTIALSPGAAEAGLFDTVAESGRDGRWDPVAIGDALPEPANGDSIALERALELAEAIVSVGELEILVAAAMARIPVVVAPPPPVFDLGRSLNAIRIARAHIGRVVPFCPSPTVLRGAIQSALRDGRFDDALHDVAAELTSLHDSKAAESCLISLCSSRLLDQ